MKPYLLILTLIIISCSEKRSSDNGMTIKRVETNKIINRLRMHHIVSNECYQKDLSYTFDFEIKFKRIEKIDDLHDSCIVSVFIIDKKSKCIIDSLNLNSIYFFETAFQTCDNVRSYSTGKNINKQVADNDFGEFIIADFNFDTKDDIAVMNENGGNGGPLYNYYIQDNKKHFRLDKFLTDSMVFFPTEINKNKKTLVTFVHASAVSVSKTTYKLYNNNWFTQSQRIIGYD